MSEKINGVTCDTEQILGKLGERIKKARLRRNISVRLLEEQREEIFEVTNCDLKRSPTMKETKAEIVLFETKDKSVSLPVEVKNETVWLNVSQMAVLFDREESNIRRHISNVFE